MTVLDELQKKKQTFEQKKEMSLPGFEPLTLDKRYLCKIRKKTPPPPRFEPGTIGMSVERANH